VFAEIAAGEMAHLASIAHEASFEEGATLFTESDEPAVLAVLAGRIVLDSAHGQPPVTVEAGDVVGVFETLAGAAIGRRAVVASAGRALRVDREELFELMGQRPELLQQLFTALFGATARTGDGMRVGVATI
jgi:CRP-like cAMP-binding protein